jgi:lysophospholipase L1-like esterase
MTRFALLLLAAFALSTCRREPPAAEPVAAAARLPEAFADEIAKFEVADRLAPPRPGGVLFVGSSSIRAWPNVLADFPGIDVLQRGFGGSELSDVVYYGPRIVLPYKPRLIVLYAGDNDIAAGKSPATVFRDYQAFVALVRRGLPETRIAFISIKPSPSRWALVDRIRAANMLVRQYAATDARLLYVDAFTPMLSPSGTPRGELFVEDSLHMNTRGYALWRDLLTPIVSDTTR